MVQYDDFSYSRERINKEYTRREMRNVKLHLTPEDFEAFNEYCKAQGISKQQFLEQSVKHVIGKEGE